MNQLLTQASLFLWLPIVVGLFVFLSPRRAVIASYVTAWLALPNIGFNISGMPNYTKMSATVASVLTCMFVFHQTKVWALRLRWYDWPMIVSCISPFVTSISNDLGVYEGLSALLDVVVSWGLPYLIGRVYFTDLDAARDLALGIAIGGLAYVPLCLFEIRFSPVLETYVYGIAHWEPMRYGGYRPKVFLATGLELGMWMTNATLLCYQIWSCGSLKFLRGIPMWLMTLVIFVTTILCKSTGSLMLLLFGVAILWITKRTKRSWAIWIMISIAPLYTMTRSFNLWSGQEVVEVSSSMFGGDRAQSYEYRLYMENQLASRALERPIFGWGRFNRNQILNTNGFATTIPDGFWIITLGVNGLVGLGSLLAMMTLPLVLTMRRFPIATWSDPRVGPLVGLSVLLALCMIDFLSNAMYNPIYAVVMGAVVGQSAVRLGDRRQEAEASLANASELMIEGQTARAEESFRQAIDFASDGDDPQGRRVQAEALDGLGHTLAATGRLEDAEQVFREALLVRDWLASRTQEPGPYRDLAIARESLARALLEIGRPAEAIEERRIALQIWEILVTDHPRNADFREHRLEALNNLAWLLATDPDPRLRDPVQAVRLAEEALSESPDHLASWNTLGVARYRSGEWAEAIEALEHSALSSPDGQGTSFDHFFISMAWSQLQHDEMAREWLERGIAWASRHRPGHPALERFREEAERLLTVQDGPAHLENS